VRFWIFKKAKVKMRTGISNAEKLAELLPVNLFWQSPTALRSENDSAKNRNPRTVDRCQNRRMLQVADVDVSVS